MQMNRREIIERALESYASSTPKRTHEIEYRGAKKTVEIVILNPEVPLLNPNNSRLRAQLRTHPNHEQVAREPYSAESQALLFELLSQTEKFEEMKTQLVDWGQVDPGIISRDGLLINGNTRLAAIKALGLNGIEVAVLPEDAVDDDFFNIEMSLQLRKLVHQDYTFTNKLLLVEANLERTQSEEATIKAMQWKRGGKQKLKDYQGYLQIIEEVRSLNPSLQYSFFDTRSELIKNLHDTYVSLLAQSPSRAERFKQSRILGMMLGLNKDEVREIGESFIEEEITNSDIPEIDELLRHYKSDALDSDPLDDLLDEKEESNLNLNKLVSDIAKKVVGEDGFVDENLVDKNFKKLHTKIRSTAREIREDRVNEEMRSEPIEHLREVTRKIEELADRIPSLFSDEEFNKGKFAHQSRKTKQAIEKLSAALSRATGQ